MKILVLTSSSGGGHDMRAQSLKKWAEHPDARSLGITRLSDLARFFPAGQGAFGCEAESRAELIAIARQQSGDWPAGRTVAVGDTPADVSGAREAGIHVVGFGPGLDDADAVIESMSELSGPTQYKPAPLPNDENIKTCS